MIFRDSVSISKPVNGTYSQENTGVLHDVKCILSITGGLKRGGSFDALAGDATAYLDPNDAWLKSINYDIANYYVKTYKFGDRTFRITNVAYGERHASDGSLSHIEVELEGLA